MATADQVTSEVAPSRTGTPTTPLAKKEKVNSAQWRPVGDSRNRESPSPPHEESSAGGTAASAKGASPRRMSHDGNTVLYPAVDHGYGDSVSDPFRKRKLW